MATSNVDEEAKALLENFKRILALPPSETLIGQNRLNLLDSINLLPEFSGEDPKIPLQKFLDAFEYNAKFFGWGEEEKLFALRNKLFGQAKSLLDIHLDANDNTEKIIKLLKDRFVTHKSSGDLLADFFAFTQPKNTTVVDYIAQAKQKVRRVSEALRIPQESREETENTWLINMLLKNLHNDIRRGVIAKCPKNISELEIAACAEEVAWRAMIDAQAAKYTTFPLNPQATEFVGNIDVKGSKQNEEVNELKELIQNLSLKLDAVTNQVVDLSNNQRRFVQRNSNTTTLGEKFNNVQSTCFHCKEIGHIRRVCPYLAYPDRIGNAQRGRGVYDYRAMKRNESHRHGGFNQNMGPNRTRQNFQETVTNYGFNNRKDNTNNHSTGNSNSSSNYQGKRDFKPRNTTQSTLPKSYFPPTRRKQTEAVNMFEENPCPENQSLN